MKKRNFSLLICTIISSFLFNACKNNDRKKIESVKKNVDITIPQQIKPADKNIFDSSFSTYFFAKYPLLSSISTEWNSFYQSRNYSFAWVDTSGITNVATNLHNRVNNLSDDGLNDSLHYRTAFNTLYEKAITLSGIPFKDSTIIETEMMLTAQYFMYAKQIYEIIDADELKAMGWNITPNKISYTEFLSNALSNKENAFENEPIYYQYALLKNYLKKYKEIANKGGLPLIDTTLKNITIGEENDAIQNLKKYLFAVGDLAISDSSIIYDTATSVALRQCRVRFGLKDTALIDKFIVQHMNVPIEERIKQILINMQRCRWMPNNPSENLISVNIPDFTMNVYENNKLQFSTNVVVGALATKTVIFNDTLKTIAFSPYWNVPYSIYKKELAGRSSESLRRKNMEYYGNNQVRQLPGGNNALGKVKFLFPNNYNIYFHDTPQKDKFNYTQRTFSHGCIRLSEPKKLAQYLLRNEPKFNEVVIDSLMNQTKETQVKLKKPIPVTITYFTCFVKNNDLLNFRKDVYDYDGKVLEGFVKK